MKRSAGAVVVRQEDGQWRFLVLPAYRNWDFPKGLVEPGEEPLEAAKREVAEETGLSDLDFHWGEIYRETRPYYSGGKKVARCYIAKTAQYPVTLPVNLELGRPEHHEYRWVTAEQLKEKVSERLMPVVRWAEQVLKAEP